MPRIQVCEREAAFTRSPRRPLPESSTWGRRPIDSFAPAHSPFGLPVYLAVPNRSVLLRQAAFRCAVLRVGSPETQNAPMELTTGHFVLATSYSRTACRRTTIGAAAFHFRVRNGNGWCHHANVTRAEKRVRCSALVCDVAIRQSLHRGASHSEAATVDSRFSHVSARAADSLTSTYRKKNVIRDSLYCYIGFSDSRFKFQRFTELQELRFVLRSFLSSVCRSAKARNGLTEK